jgi:uncharacterized protein (DUF2461 family)
MAPDQLDRYRRAVADDGTGTALERLVVEVTRRRIEVGSHDTLKTAPKGYPRDHPRVDLLRNMGLVAWKEWPGAAWLGTAAAKTRLVEFLRAAQPVSDWLAAHVGEGAQAARERRL